MSYRIEVGHRDGVAPREIVGAIANEAGLEGRFIGRIAIEEDHSLVDLPEGMPREIFQHLARGLRARQAAEHQSGRYGSGAGSGSGQAAL